MKDIRERTDFWDTRISRVTSKLRASTGRIVKTHLPIFFQSKSQNSENSKTKYKVMISMLQQTTGGKKKPVSFCLLPILAKTFGNVCFNLTAKKL